MLKNSDEAAIIQQLENESDRAVAIIAATILEDRLEEALTAFFETCPKITKGLFIPSGPLGPLATKINLGFLVGIFSADARKELEAIKNIRNAFAHDLTIKDFSSQRIKDLTNNLKIPDKDVGKTVGDILESKKLDMVLYDAPPANDRDRFLISTQTYIMLLKHTTAKHLMPLSHHPWF
jgi:DNA-binding MltR family transcriptional regulator